jgi:hypothetical protein
VAAAAAVGGVVSGAHDGVGPVSVTDPFAGGVAGARQVDALSTRLPLRTSSVTVGVIMCTLQVAVDPYGVTSPRWTRAASPGAASDGVGDVLGLKLALDAAAGKWLLDLAARLARCGEVGVWPVGR